jgi:pyrroloquinoline quinone biosynthesis protein D
MAAIAKLTDRFTEADIDDEIVVMRIDNGEFFSISGSGTTIWRLIDGTRDREDLLEALSDDFGGDGVDIAADVDDFLLLLRETGLLAD